MTEYKVIQGLFAPLTHDVLCAYCGSFTPQQWDDREQPMTTGWQFRWCVHELCWRCAAAVLEACPVCSVSGPANITIEDRDWQVPMPEPAPHEPIWPWFLLLSLLSAGLIAYGKGWLYWLGLG